MALHVVEGTCTGGAIISHLSSPPPSCSSSSCVVLLDAAEELANNQLPAAQRPAKNMSAFGVLVTALVLSCVAGASIAGYVFSVLQVQAQAIHGLGDHGAVHAPRQPA
ncbi:uncharacterized protein [Zea mays]|uniref:uncharacterized protein n=1 Tax=Zea mays TaxID=4577 RepID=UPI0004DEA934|nr:uncharacterized protein LOC103642048 [Zea mays]XP_035819796.1 uncharacterized protein LOC118475652 [Zea mays]|eukprot:XP_008663581.1 uncharacterized protein LOC103642048 [Zea mays]